MPGIWMLWPALMFNAWLGMWMPAAPKAKLTLAWSQPRPEKGQIELELDE